MLSLFYSDAAIDCGNVHADRGGEGPRESGNLSCTGQQWCNQRHARRAEQGK